MANDPIEELYVKIGADVSDLLDDTKKGVNQAESELKKFGRTGKQAFDNTAKSAGGLDGKMTALAASAGAFIAVFASQTLNRIVGFFQQIGAAAIQSNAQFETFTTQFETLLGSASLAEARLEELAQFGVETPFELPQVVEASRVLQVFGGDALATGDNLRMIGDIAAGVNQPFQDVSFWIGRMYDAMQSGRPFGEAAARLQEMGALSGVARARLEEMTKAGASGAELWAEFNNLVGDKFAGNMERLAGTFQGVTSNLIDFRDNLTRVAGQELFEGVRDDAERLLEIISEGKRAEAIENVAVAIGDIAATLADAATSPLLDGLDSIEAETLNDLAAALDRAALALEQLTGAEINANLNTLIELITVIIDTFTFLTNVTNRQNEIFSNAGAIYDAVKQAFIALVAPVTQIFTLFGQLNDIVAELTGSDLTDWSADLAAASETEAQAAMKARDAEAERLKGLAALQEGGQKAAEVTEEVAETIDKQTEMIQGLLDKLAGQMIDLTEDRQEKLQELEKEHGQALVEIETDYINERLSLGEELADDLAKLDEDTAEKRADILAGTRKKLKSVEDDTDRTIREQRNEFQKDERRETEDHLIEMRRLREQYLQSVDDAVKTRDARALVDARNRFEREKSEKEQEFQLNQSRESEDQDERLTQIRENEQRRTQEILSQQEEQLAQLAEQEAKKRAMLQERFQEELAELDTEHQERLNKENQQFQERQAALDEMLQKRLEAITKELADEKDINESEAQAILEALNETFGAGGDIDKLMEDFANRRKQKLVVQVGFEKNIEEDRETASRAKSSALSQLRQFRGGGSVPSFASGGTLLANKPTRALFGEVPELVQFTPLSQLGRQNGGGQPQRMEVDVRMSGSAPPGIRGQDRDAIANVLINALNQAGIRGGPPSR